MYTIEFDSKLEKPQAAFVIFYAPDAQPWEDYPIDNSGRQQLHFPVGLMINRADGNIGFIGGMVEDDETLDRAAMREVKEEIGHSVATTLKPLVAHDIGAITTHAFMAEVSYEELRNIQKEATNAEHFGSEVCGVFLPHLVDYEKTLGKGGGLGNLLKTAMAPSVREELVHFLSKKNFISQQDLAKLCEGAGYNLSKLLS